MASILSIEVHKLVQTTYLEMLSQEEADFGPLVFDTLGILQWSNLYQITKKGGILKALSHLCQYIGVLGLFDAQDRADFDRASIVTQKLVRALTPKLTCNTQSDATSESLSTPPDIVSSISQNPLIKFEFLPEPEKIRVKSVIDRMQLSQQQAQRMEIDEEICMPIISNHCIELEVSALDNTMWRIPGVNYPPPIAIALW